MAAQLENREQLPPKTSTSEINMLNEKRAIAKTQKDIKLKQVVAQLHSKSIQWLITILPSKYISTSWFFSRKTMSETFLELGIDDYIEEAFTRDDGSINVRRETLFGYISRTMKVFVDEEFTAVKKHNALADVTLRAVENILWNLICLGANPSINDNKGISPIVYLFYFLYKVQPILKSRLIFNYPYYPSPQISIYQAFRPIAAFVVEQMDLNKPFLDTNMEKGFLLDLTLRETEITHYDAALDDIVTKIETGFELSKKLKVTFPHQDNIYTIIMQYLQNELYNYIRLNFICDEQPVDLKTRLLKLENVLSIKYKREKTAQQILTIINMNKNNNIAILEKIVDWVVMLKNRVEELTENILLLEREIIISKNDIVHLEGIVQSNPIKALKQQTKEVSKIAPKSKLTLRALIEFLKKRDASQADWLVDHLSANLVDRKYIKKAIREAVLDIDINEPIPTIQETLLGHLCKNVASLKLNGHRRPYDQENYALGSLLDFGADPNIPDSKGVLPIVHMIGIDCNFTTVNRSWDVRERIMARMDLTKVFFDNNGIKMTLFDLVFGNRDEEIFPNDAKLGAIFYGAFTSRIESELSVIPEYLIQTIQERFEINIIRNLIIEYARNGLFDYTVKYNSKSTESTMLREFTPESKNKRLRVAIKFDFVSVVGRISFTHLDRYYITDYVLKIKMEINKLQLKAMALEKELGALKEQKTFLIAAKHLNPKPIGAGNPNDANHKVTFEGCSEKIGNKPRALG